MIQDCLTNKSLDDFTTYKIGGKADKVFLPETKAELIDTIKTEDNNTLILGCGSNVLISSNGYNGSIIITKNLNTISLTGNNKVYAEAGAFSPKVSQFCLRNHLSGVEFLSCIPGTIGGAICMNSSAGEQSIENIIDSAEVFNRETNELEIWTKDQFNFEYRKSKIDGKKHFVISAILSLTIMNPELISERMNKHLDFRKTKQPKGFNAGSVFKNPDNNLGLSAGYLLDQAGVKGWQEGDAYVSKLHANFIINNGNATSANISKLILRMHNAVKEKTGFKLHPEIKYIGKTSKEEEEIWKNLLAQ